MNVRWPKTRWSAKQFAQCAGLLAVCLALALFSDRSFIGRRIDNYAYDSVFNLFPPGDWPAHSVILAIDEDAYRKYGRNQLRPMLVDALKAMRGSHPKAIGIDIVLADAGRGGVDAQVDAQLEAALRDTPNVVLSCEFAKNQWEFPLERFKQYAKGIGHVHPQELQPDGVNRAIPVEIDAAGLHYWALALETFRVAEGAPFILESPLDLTIGKTFVPVGRYEGKRMLALRYRTSGIEKISLVDLVNHPEMATRLDGKVVFVGVTAMTARNDQMVTPYGDNYVSGIDIHAQTLETLAEGRFIVNASDLSIIAVCLIIGLLMFGVFAMFSGRTAYLAAGAVLVFAHAVPVPP